jgi:hypothetical protein
MPRRIWISEGVASDGAVYSRSLHVPDRNERQGIVSSGGGTGVQRIRTGVLKSHLGDIPSCPCLASLLHQDDDTTVADSPAVGG